MRIVDADELHYKEFKCSNGKIVRAVTERDIRGAKTISKSNKWIRRKGMNEQCPYCNKYFPLWKLEDKFDIEFCPHCGNKLER